MNEPSPHGAEGEPIGPGHFLPGGMARKRQSGQQFYAERIPDATVLYCDIVRFSELALQGRPARIVSLLEETFSRFDELAGRRGLQRIRTYGSAYLLAAGVDPAQTDGDDAIAQVALDLLAESAQMETGIDGPLQLRIGLDRGALLTGFFGADRITFDVWGEPVRTAHAMESTAPPDSIQVTRRIHDRLAGRFVFEHRGTFCPTVGEQIDCFLLTGRAAEQPGPEQA